MRHERWDGIYGVLGSDGREWGRTVIVNDWALLEGCSTYTSGESLPPPDGSGRFVSQTGQAFTIFRRHDGRGRYIEGFVPEPEPPEPYRRRAEVQEVSHRVWQDYGTDGVRRWPRWWCSCGAHGQGWPTNHPEENR